MQTIRQPVLAELDAVNRLIVKHLESDVDLVENIGHYIVEAGGKRLRPLLALLSARSCGYTGEDHVTFATLIEFIHTATLLHDDVVDISALRRGRPTANAEFGNASSVLVGDFLYTRAFQLMVQLENMDIMRDMAQTTNTIAAGEVLQLTRAGRADTDEATYLDVITRKTAILFASACYGGALLAAQDPQRCTALRNFGMDVGIAFQMVDDLLDYEGDPQTTGKNIGDDLAEGKPTLPLIYVLREGSQAQQNLVRDAITEKSAERLNEVIASVRDSGALDYTRAAAQRHCAQALEALSSIQPGPCRDSMEAIANLSINRDH